MSEMVERVARAIHAAMNDPANYPWFHVEADKCRLTPALARAAIGAMLLHEFGELPEAMAIAGEEAGAGGYLEAHRIFGAMIDAALSSATPVVPPIRDEP